MTTKAKRKLPTKGNVAALRIVPTKEAANDTVRILRAALARATRGKVAGLILIEVESIQRGVMLHISEDLDRVPVFCLGVLADAQQHFHEVLAQQRRHHD